MKIVYVARSILAVGYFLFATIVLGSSLIASVAILQSGWLPNRLAANVKNWRNKSIDFLSWAWGRSIQWAFNMHVHLSGEENIPQGGCLFVFNHTSHFDILSIYGRLKKSARFGAKIELFKIPLFGSVLRSAGMLPIVRTDRAAVLKLYSESISRVHAGESFLLAAEGTRQTAPGIGTKFKSGPFIFAIDGQFPIVPIVIKGATACLPKGRMLPCTDRWRYDIYLKILPPIATKGLTLENRDQLKTQTRELMAREYERLP